MPASRLDAAVLMVREIAAGGKPACSRASAALCPGRAAMRPAAGRPA